MVTSHTLTGDLFAILEATKLQQVAAYLEPNTTGHALVSDQGIHMGRIPLNLADGAFSVSGVWNTDEVENLRWRVVVEYTDGVWRANRSGSGGASVRSNWFTMTADADLAEKWEQVAPLEPPQSNESVTKQYRDEALAAAAALEAVEATNDGIMTAVAQDGESSFSAALSATIGAQVTSGSTGSQTRVANPNTNAISGTPGLSNVIAGGGTTGNENEIKGTNTAGVNVISGGYDHTIDTGGAGANTIAGGGHNEITGSSTDHGTVGGGSFNKVEAGHYNTIPGGTLNEVDTGAGDNNTIGGGTSNHVTAGVSGTVGGGSANEIVSGNFNVIGGGSSNKAEAGSATVSGGGTNRAIGSGATVGGGVQNEVGTTGTTRGNYGSIGGGFQNKIGDTGASAYATVGGGRGNKVNGDYGTVTGGQDCTAVSYATAGGRGAQANSVGQWTYAGGQFAAAGDHQASLIQSRLVTADATANQLTVPNVVLANSQVVSYRAMVTAVDIATGDVSMWTLSGAVKRSAAGVASFVGGAAPTAVMVVQDAGASTWAVNQIVASGQIVTRVTGEASKTIRWAVRYDTVDVKFA